jgi:uncharacterized protein (DUF342 family)
MTGTTSQPDCPAGSPAPDADVDAMVRFGATQDRMKLCVSCYVPAQGFGTPLSVDLVRQRLKEAGLDSCLDLKGLALAVHLLLSGQDAAHVAIARGVRPRKARDAWVKPLADFSLPVFPGQAFGRLRPAQQAAPGRDVTGLVLPAPPGDPPRDLTLPEDQSCTLDRDGLLRAQVYGLVRQGEGRVWVEPLFRVSPDRLAVSADLYAQDALGKAVGVRRILDELARMGVVEGVQTGRIMAALEQARTGRTCVENVIVAEGRPPEHGRDGWLEMFLPGRSDVGTPVQGGRMDWRERGFSPVVAAGRNIARLHAPGEGVPGRNVFGGEVPARSGTPLTVWPGPNVEVLEGGVLFRAAATGAVLYSRNILEVSDLLAVSGDVDHATGNIRVQEGSVLVKGSVRSGFTIQAQRAVFVDEVVENCRILAGGDVFVNGGVFMSGERDAYIRAGGSVSAAYTHNARILAGGDVTISQYITSSSIQAGYRVRSGGRVRVTDPRGRIMGGVVICAEGLEVYEAGSPLGVGTVLALSRETPELRQALEERRRCLEILERAVRLYGEAPAAQVLPRFPAERRPEIAALLAGRDEARQRLPQIAETLNRLAQAAQSRATAASILVRGPVHPGVVVKMGNRIFTVERPMTGVRFHWDAKGREIALSRA